MKPNDVAPIVDDSTKLIHRLSHFEVDRAVDFQSLSHYSSTDLGNVEIKHIKPPPKPPTFNSIHKLNVLDNIAGEGPEVDEDTGVQSIDRHESEVDYVIEPAAGDPEKEVSKISVAKEMVIQKDTYDVMLKEVDHTKLGARPKVKLKPSTEMKPTEPEKKYVKSREIIDKFEQLVKDDKKNCQDDKIHANKIVKTEVSLRESGLKSVVKGCQVIIKKDSKENAAKSEGDGLNKLRFGRVKPKDLEGETQLNLTPIREKIKLGNVAKLKDGFDKLMNKSEGDDLPILKRLKASSPLPLTPRKKFRKSSRSSAIKKAIVDSNQPLILDFYRGKPKDDKKPDVDNDDLV